MTELTEYEKGWIAGARHVSMAAIDDAIDLFMNTLNTWRDLRDSKTTTDPEHAMRLRWQ